MTLHLANTNDITQVMHHYQILIPKFKIGVLDYSCMQDIELGSYVLVPFRNKQEVGIVWGK